MPLTLSLAGEYVTVFGGIAALAGFVLRWAWRGYRSAKGVLDDILTTLTVLQEDISAIKNEVKYNGGSSLKDQVGRMARSLDQLHHETRVSTAARRISQSRAILEMVVTPDGETRCSFVSTEWTRLTGLSKSDIDDGGWLRCIPVSDQPRIQHLAELANRDVTLFQAEYPIRNVTSGVRHYVRHLGYPVLGDARQLVGWVGELTELSEA